VRSERHKQEMRNKSDKQEPGKAKRKKWEIKVRRWEIETRNKN
jgi:hypothetical protein